MVEKTQPLRAKPETPQIPKSAHTASWGPVLVFGMAFRKPLVGTPLQGFRHHARLRVSGA